MDNRKAERFAQQVMETLNGGAVSLMLSLGHRTGLFDALEGSGPATSQAIAERAGLQERYVREWLGCMVTARIVEYDAEQNTYCLPPEHGAFLSRRHPKDNLAVLAQYVPVLAQVEDALLECFRSGGGVPYSQYPRFHAVMAEDSGQSTVSALLEDILPLAAGVTERLKEGIQVADLGCGSARALLRMAESFPRSRFLGIDLSTEAIESARRAAREKGLTNLDLRVGDLSQFHEWAEPDSLDFVTTFDAVHDQAQPLHLLRGIRRALRPGGVYLMQDIKGSSYVHRNLDNPIAPFLYAISCMHCMTVSLAQGGEGLGAMWGEELAREYLKKAGFTEVTVRTLPHDIQNNYYVCS